ncbi:FliA/WhiG family RNA polymerase sigma factor [Bacillus fonticola]|uniref:FliA/WhiG family RNA polymerase sigma factor n=1 Tax=Bacillus fonticola TaxID=2728853 RepID=UPI001473C0E1|nr:FliA/WhiG family RNA polymerase sigma factor [Bacillus fonticola]
MAQSARASESYIWEQWTVYRDDEAGNALIEKYRPLVHFHVQRIAAGLPKNVSKDDIESWALFGLYDAIEKFEPARDLKFDTYASFRVRGAILDGLRKEDWLPRSTREKAKRIDAMTEKLTHTFNRQPTTEELADALEWTSQEVEKVLADFFLAHVVSIDETPQDSDEENRSFILKDERTVTPEESITKQEWIEELTIAVGILTEKEQLVLSLFYKEECTLTEIGHILELTTSRISQIHSKALSKLQLSLSTL